MTEQEIEDAAANHVKELPNSTRLTGHFAFKGGARWADEYYKTHPDEYAEEYAKAFLIWTRNNKTYPMDAQTCLESFKESLKK